MKKESNKGVGSKSGGHGATSEVGPKRKCRISGGGVEVAATILLTRAVL